MGMDRRRGVRRKRDRPSGTQRGGLHESADPAATRRIRLQHVDRLGVEHPPKIERVVAVLAGGNVHSRRRRDRASAAAPPDRRTSPALRTNVTSNSANRSAWASACFALYAPLASTNNSASAADRLASRARTRRNVGCRHRGRSSSLLAECPARPSRQVARATGDRHRT